MMKLIYNLTMHRSKRYLIKKYSKEKPVSFTLYMQISM